MDTVLKRIVLIYQVGFSTVVYVLGTGFMHQLHVSNYKTAAVKPKLIIKLNAEHLMTMR